MEPSQGKAAQTDLGQVLGRVADHDALLPRRQREKQVLPMTFLVAEECQARSGLGQEPRLLVGNEMAGAGAVPADFPAPFAV